MNMRDKIKLQMQKEREEYKINKLKKKYDKSGLVIDYNTWKMADEEFNKKWNE